MILPNGRVMVGSHAVAIEYRKNQKHACDPKCKAAGHLYRHPYKKPVPVMAARSGRREVTVPAQEFIRRDGEREHYAIDNPPLVIVNSPKGVKKMATIRMKRNSKGQFVAARARSNAPRKHSRKKGHRRNPPFWTAGAIVNSPKHKKKAARRNPPRAANFLGIPLVMPEVSDVFGIAGGIAGPPIVKGFAMQLLPASVTSSTAGKWGVEIGSYVLPPVAGYMIGGRRVLRMVFAGQLAGLVVRLVQQAAAKISASLPAAGVAGYITGPRAARTGVMLNGYTGPVSRAQLSAGAGTASRMSNRGSRWTGQSKWAGTRTR